MTGIHAIINNTPAANQTQKPENKSSNNTGISFGTVFDAVRRGLDGIMVVSQNDSATQPDFQKTKLEIEKKREFKTDLEEAHELLSQISKIMEKHGQSGKK